MYQTLSLSLIAILLTSLGCGKGQGNKSDKVIACDRRESTQFLGGTCSDWDKETQADHEAVGMCDDEGAIPRKELCPPEGRVGTCNVRNQEKRYYPPKFTPESAKEDCALEDGVWKP